MVFIINNLQLKITLLFPVRIRLKMIFFKMIYIIVQISLKLLKPLLLLIVPTHLVHIFLID